MASTDRGYWSRSWELLTRDEGWFKPVLVLAAARFLPIVGPFGADGYALEWARLTSWGVDSSPKQKGVDISACIRSGAKAFVVSLGYLLTMLLVRYLVGLIFGPVLGSLFSLVLTLAMSVLIVVAKLRATIYQTIGAGYQVDRIFDMAKRDHRGLLRIMGLVTVMALTLSVIISIVGGLVVATSMGGAFVELARMEMYDYVDEWRVINTFLAALATAMPIVCVFLYGVSILHTITNLISTTAVGLWMRQFDVNNWGDSSDPLPSTSASSTAYAGYPTSHTTVSQGSGAASYQSGQGAQTVPEPVDGTSEGYGYGSKTGSWDDGRGETTIAEPGPATENSTDIPILPIESFGDDGSPATTSPSEPDMFELRPVDEAPSADTGASDMLETSGLQNAEEASGVSQWSDATDLLESQNEESLQVPEASDDIALFDLQGSGEPVASEDVSVQGMPLDTFGSCEADQTEGTTEEQAGEVECFPLFDTPEPTSTFPIEESLGHVEQGEIPVGEETHVERRRNTEPLMEEEVLRRTEEAIRASDMTAWDIPQTAQPTGSVSSFALDDFEAETPAAESVLEIPEAVVSEDADADQDEAAQSKFEQFMDAAIDGVASALLDVEHVAEDDSADEDVVSEEIIEAVRISGTPDEPGEPKADSDASDVEEDA